MGQKKVIALDAGHGMGTSGKRCLKRIDPAETREWYLNDRIADLVEEDLKKNYDCTVLRVDDTTGVKDISLSARVKAANSSNADIYISIHHNAGLAGRSGGGTAVYYCSSEAARPDQAKRLYDAVVNKTGLVGNRSSKVIKYGFYVIKNTKMPAFLIENGFMDSPTDTPIILTAAHAQKTAQGIVDFLVKELGLGKTNGSAQDTSAPDNPQENENLPYVTVNKGDTLSAIGKKLGISWKEIADLNGISSPYTIHIGQKLQIPAKSSGNAYYPAYTGKTVTLYSALMSLGIPAGYSSRQKIAVANGINIYVNTANQNAQLYNLLVAGLLKKA